jgi:hypothetical protein
MHSFLLTFNAHGGLSVKHMTIAWLVLLVLTASPALANPALVGIWRYQDAQVEIVAEFFENGTFRQATVTSRERMTHTGRYQFDGEQLFLMVDGSQAPDRLLCHLADSDTAMVTYANGQTLTWKRIGAQKSPASGGNLAQPPASGTPAGALHAGTSTASAVQTGKKIPVMLLQRIWEPKENAFSFLLPKGWKVEGGVFNVNPLKMNGAGNTISPKCDLTAKADGEGIVMLRWVPSWNYADLSLAPTGWGAFRPGTFYQGMPVKPLIGPRPFLLELLKTTRPRATELKILAEDPMQEVVAAYTHRAEQINQHLMRMGLAPTRFEALGLVVEYREGSELFREVLMATIADARGGAFMWSNDDTLAFRAPSAGFETWKPVLDTIRMSRQMNPQWVAAVTRASGERAKAALETQRYIANVANQIVENRRRTHAEMRHEQWLFISGQEEYTNPFTGQTDIDTSYYPHRWMNNQGDVIYADENSFDPNEMEEYKTREWKRSSIRQR